jgi:hypothetical protein
MGSLQLLFSGGTRWNLSLHAPTVKASISSTWRARAVRFFSLYFPTLCHSLHLSLYCEILAKESICSYREGWDRGKGWDFQCMESFPCRDWVGARSLPFALHLCKARDCSPHPPFARSGCSDRVEDALRAPSMQLGKHCETLLYR